MKTEAVGVVAAVEAAVVAIITILALQLEWDATMTGAAIAAGSAIVIAIGAIVARAFVWSQESHDREVDAALLEEPPR